MIPPEEYHLDTEGADVLITIAVYKDAGDGDRMMVSYQLDKPADAPEEGMSPVDLLDIISSMNTTQQKLVHDWLESYFSDEGGDDFRVDEELR